jgi:hypothetical protein
MRRGATATSNSSGVVAAAAAVPVLAVCGQALQLPNRPSLSLPGEYLKLLVPVPRLARAPNASEPLPSTQIGAWSLRQVLTHNHLGCINCIKSAVNI